MRRNLAFDLSLQFLLLDSKGKCQIVGWKMEIEIELYFLCPPFESESLPMPNKLGSLTTHLCQMNEWMNASKVKRDKNRTNFKLPHSTKSYCMEFLKGWQNFWNLHFTHIDKVQKMLYSTSHSGKQVGKNHFQNQELSIFLLRERSSEV